MQNLCKTHNFCFWFGLQSIIFIGFAQTTVYNTLALVFAGVIIGGLGEPADPEERTESLFQFSSVVSPQQKKYVLQLFCVCVCIAKCGADTVS